MDITRNLLALMLLASAMLWASVCTATDVSGGNIEVVCLGNNDYEVTANIFVDCTTSGIPSTTQLKIVPLCGGFSPTINLDFVPIESADVSQLCTAEAPNSACQGGVQPGAYRQVYRKVITLPTSCDGYRLYIRNCNRKATTNVDPQADPVNFACVYIENIVYRDDLECNSTPQITNQFIPYVCAGQDVSYNFGAFDADGDSLSYSFVSALTSTNADVTIPFPVTYNPGYSGTQPIPGITIDPVTGQINFNSTIAGTFNVVVFIEQFDEDGSSIGGSTVEVIFYVLNCLNDPPQQGSLGIENFSGTATQTGALEVDMCFGEDFCFEYEFFSPEATPLFLETNIDEVLPGATVSTLGTNPLRVFVCWTATEGSVGGTVLLRAKDDLCPVPGFADVGISVNVDPGVFAGPDRTICQGGSVQVNAIGDTDYQWTTVSGDPIIVGTTISCDDCPDPILSPTQPTVYQVTGVSGAAECSDTDLVAVDIGFEAEVTVFAETCAGNDGSMTINMPSGSGDFTFDIGGDIYSVVSENDFSLDNLSGGEYVVVITDDVLGCSTDTTVTIATLLPPTPNAGPDAQLCVGDTTAFIFALSGTAGSGGTQWTAPGASVAQSNLLNTNVILPQDVYGDYIITLTEDAGFGCVGSDSFVLTVTDAPNADAGPDTLICGTTYQLAATAATGIGSWSGGPVGTTFTPNASTYDAVATVPTGTNGTFDFFWVDNVDGCISSDIAVISFYQSPNADAGPDRLICGNQDSLHAVLPAGISSGVWTWDASTSNVINPIDPDSRVSGDPGPQTFTWTVDNNGCLASDQVVLTFDSTVQPDAGPDRSSCTDEVSMLGANALGEGSWYSPTPAINAGILDPTDPQTIVTSSNAGTYAMIFVTGQSPCELRDTVMVTFEDEVISIGGPDLSFCTLIGGLMESSDPADGVSHWETSDVELSIADVLDPNTSVSASSYGVFEMDWIKVVGECSDTSTVQVTFVDVVAADAGSDTTFCGTQGVLTANGTSGQGQWTLVSGSAGFSMLTEPTTTVSVVTVPQQVVVQWTLDTQGCSSTDELTIDFVQTPSVNAGPDATSCSNTYELNATSSTGSGQWSPATGISDINDPNAQLSFSGEGTVDLTWTVAPGSACEVSDQVTITFFDGPDADAGQDTTVCGLSLTLYAEASIDPDLMGNDAFWSGPSSGITFIGGDNTSPNATIEASAYGDYVLIWRESRNSCTSADTLTVEFLPTPAPSLGADTTICGLNYVADVADVVGSGIWSSTPALTFIPQDAPDASVTASSAGIYDIIWTETIGQCVGVDTLRIDFVGDLAVSAGNDTLICGASGQLSADDPETGDGTWSTADIGLTIDDASLASTQISGPAGQYTLVWTYTISNTNGTVDCISTDEVTITLNGETTTNAGPNQPGVCGDMATLDAQVSFGTGAWSPVPDVIFTDINDPESTVTTSIYGEITFEWMETATSGNCAASDEVIIDFIRQPEADAGADTIFCSLSGVLNGQPSVGIGQWSGAGIDLDAPESATTTVTALDGPGQYTLIWTEINAVCQDSDTLQVTFNDPGTIDAGPDAIVCGLVHTGDASPASGSWTLPLGVTASNITDPNATLTADALGVYELGWTSGPPSCPVTDVVEVDFRAIPTPDAGPDISICGLAGSIEALPSGFTGQWTSSLLDLSDTGAGSADVLAPFFGTFPAIWTETNGGQCAVSDTVNITFIDTPVANAGPDRSVCGLSINLDAEGGFATGQWTLLDGGTVDALNSPNAIFTGTEFGAYQAVWSLDAQGCMTSDTTVITLVQTPAANAGPDLSYCGLTGVTAALPSTGEGVWSWTGDFTILPANSPEAEVTVTQAGSYVLTWTETNGQCESADMMTITFSEQPLADAGEDRTICGLSAVLDATPTAGTGLWSGPAGVTFSPEPSDPAALLSVTDYGVYTFQWTEVNGSCQDEDELTLTFVSTADSANVTFQCINGNTEYQVSFDIINGDESSYEVSGLGGTLSGSNFISDPLPTGANYSFFLTDANACETIAITGNHSCISLSAAGSMDQDTLHACVGTEVSAQFNGGEFVDPNDALVFILHDQAGVTVGDVIQTNSTPTFGFVPGMSLGMTYYISSVVGDSTATGSVDLDAPGTSISSGTPLVYHALPSADLIGEDYTFCTGEVVDIGVSLNGSAPFTLAYEIDGIPSVVESILTNDYTIETTTNGLLDLTLVEDAFCSTEPSEQTIISEYDVPTLSVPGEWRTCSDAPEALPLTLSGAGPWSYDVSFNGGTDVTLTSNASDLVLSITGSGQYVFTDLNDTNCLSEVVTVVNVEVVESPALLAGEDISACSGQTVLLGVPEIDTYTYLWESSPDLSSISLAQPTISLENGSSTPISQTYELTVTNDICSSNDQIEVTTLPLPLDYGIDGPEVLCAEQSAALNAFGGVEYAWSESPDLNSWDISSPTVSPATSSSYQVEIFNQYGCSVMDSITIEVSPIPVGEIVVDVLTGCVPFEITYTALTSGAEGSVCEWITDGGEVLTETCDQLSLSYTRAGQYTAALTIISADGCSGTILSTDTIDANGVKAAIAYQPSIPTIDDPWIQAFDQTKPDAVVWSWTLMEEVISTEQHPYIDLDSLPIGEYDLCLTTISSDGCLDSTCVVIDLQNNFQIWIPLSFTPDGDGLNDTFGPVVNHPEDLDSYEFKIFDRSGRLQFETSDPNAHWDATNLRDKVLKQGLFEWEVFYRTKTEFKFKQERGSVLLSK